MLLIWSIINRGRAWFCSFGALGEYAYCHSAPSLIPLIFIARLLLKGSIPSRPSPTMHIIPRLLLLHFYIIGRLSSVSPSHEMQNNPPMRHWLEINFGTTGGIRNKCGFLNTVTSFRECFRFRLVKDSIEAIQKFTFDCLNCLLSKYFKNHPRSYRK